MVFHKSLSDGTEWQQVSLSLQDSSQYSGLFQPRCCLDGLHSSSYFQVRQSGTNPLMIVPSAPLTIGITVTFMFHGFSVL